MGAQLSWAPLHVKKKVPRINRKKNLVFGFVGNAFCLLAAFLSFRYNRVTLLQYFLAPEVRYDIQDFQY